MLTTMYVDDECDGLEYLVHAEDIFDENGDYSHTEAILDENGEYIPATICLCHAHEPSECCCGCVTNWPDYPQPYDYDSEE